MLDTENGFPVARAATVVSNGEAPAGVPVGLGADGKLDRSVLPTGVGPELRVLEASEDLFANDLVNMYYDTEDETPKWKVRLAAGTDGYHYCNGFVKEAYESGNPAMVYLDGTFEVSAAVIATLNNPALYLSAVSPGKPAAYDADAEILQIVGYLIGNIGETGNGIVKFSPSTAIRQD
jgi:hypothetical protein